MGRSRDFRDLESGLNPAPILPARTKILRDFPSRTREMPSYPICQSVSCWYYWIVVYCRHMAASGLKL